MRRLFPGGVKSASGHVGGSNQLKRARDRVLGAVPLSKPVATFRALDGRSMDLQLEFLRKLFVRARLGDEHVPEWARSAASVEREVVANSDQPGWDALWLLDRMGVGTTASAGEEHAPRQGGDGIVSAANAQPRLTVPSKAESSRGARLASKICAVSVQDADKRQRVGPSKGGGRSTLYDVTPGTPSQVVEDIGRLPEGPMVLLLDPVTLGECVMRCGQRR